MISGTKWHKKCNKAVQNPKLRKCAYLGIVVGFLKRREAAQQGPENIVGELVVPDDVGVLTMVVIDDVDVGVFLPYISDRFMGTTSCTCNLWVLTPFLC